MDIGIDLGTTFSVVAVKGRHELARDYPPPKYLEECDVTIIPTPQGDFTFPSVLWADPEDPNNVLVGIEAKQKAEDGFSPIMFSKRSIGTDEKLALNNRTYTAREVAEHILRYLKRSAERALGQPVTRAVVTHPAYFKRKQVEETRDAAEAAGFDMSDEKQMMMEPKAAALAYLQGNDADPLRVLVYDLGGGTFDVTVLERSHGVTEMKKFDGNHLLGGYNFDRALIKWILDGLEASGRVITLDEDNPEDRGRRARLLQLAERVKIRLTEQHSSKVYVDINAPDILVDDKGLKVQILNRITREEFAGLIKDDLVETIERCNNALEKAGIDPGDLDSVLLVGGSTYAQWVREAVSSAFDIDVEPYIPDLCVAAGAAIATSELSDVGSGTGIMVTMDMKSKWSLRNYNVDGTVTAEDGEPLDEETRSGLSVFLTAPNGETLGPCPLTEKGGFIFEDVELLEDEASNFVLQVVDGGGLELYSKRFTVEYLPEGGKVVKIERVLSHSYFLKTYQGLVPLALEGAVLPAKCEVRLKRLWDGSMLCIDIFEDEDKIGTIDVTGIPEDAGEGAPVVLSAEFTTKSEIRGKVQVLTRSGTVAREVPVAVTTPPDKVPSLPDLRSRFDSMKAECEQSEHLSDDPEHRLILRGKGRKLINKLQNLLSEQPPDKQEVHAALRELERMVRPPAEDMDPPKSEFNGLVDECSDLIQTLGTDPQAQRFANSLQKMRDEGNDAFVTKNQRKWSIVNDKLAKLRAKLDRAGSLEEEGRKDTQPTTWQLKDHYKLEVDQLRTALRSKRAELERGANYEKMWREVCDNIDRALDQMEIAIDKVDEEIESNKAHAQLQLATRRKDRLAQDIKKLGSVTEKG